MHPVASCFRAEGKRTVLSASDGSTEPGGATLPEGRPQRDADYNSQHRDELVTGGRSSIDFIAEHAAEPCVPRKGREVTRNLKCYNMTINADHGRSAPIGRNLVELSEHSRIRSGSVGKTEMKGTPVRLAGFPDRTEAGAAPQL